MTGLVPVLQKLKICGGSQVDVSRPMRGTPKTGLTDDDSTNVPSLGALGPTRIVSGT